MCWWGRPSAPSSFFRAWQDPTLRFRDERHRSTDRRSPVRAVLRFVASVMIVSGLLLIGDAGVTLAWQEPVSAFLAQQEQTELRKSLDHPPPGRRGQRRKPLRGDAIGRSTCPRSTSPPTWWRAPTPTTCARARATTTTPRCPASAARWPSPGTAPPTAPRSATSTSSTPATRSAGDALRDASSTGSSEPASWIPPRLWVKDKVGYNRLILSACHPLYSAAQRIVVFARYVRRTEATVQEG